MTMRVLGFLFLALIPAAPAAEPVASFPAGNFRAAATVVRDDPDAKKPAAAEAAKVPVLLGLEMTRTGGIRQYRMTWQNGAVTEIWSEGGVSVVQHPNGSVYVLRDRIYTLPDLAAFTDASLAWLQDATARGEDKYHDKPCLVFERDMVFPENLTVRYRAWIDPETRRPVAMHDGVSTYEFSYEPDAPAVPPVMPDFLKKELDRYRAAMTPPRRL